MSTVLYKLMIDDDTDITLFIFKKVVVNRM